MEEDKYEMRKIIDFHTHFFPEKLQNAIYDWFEKYGWGIYHRYTLEEAVNHLKSIGYEKWVIAVYAHKPGISESLNSWLGEITKKHPAIIPFGTVHQEDNVREIVKTAFEMHGIVGIKFHTHIARVSPEDPRLFPAYEEIIKHNGILLLHGSIHPTDAGFVSDFDPYEVSGAEHVEKLLEKFPEMVTIVAHLGMGEYEEFGELMEKYPNLYLDTTMVHCMKDVKIKHPETPPPPSIEFILKHINRILYGSDFPFLPYHIERQITAIENLPIQANQLKVIFFDNAIKLLEKQGHL